MASDRKLDETISAWLEETAPTGLPQRVLTATFERTRRSRQRLVWRMVLRRPQMPRLAPTLGGVVVVVATAVLALNVIPSVGPRGPSTPPPTASPLRTSASHAEAEQIVADGTLVDFAASTSGTLLTIWETCDGTDDSECGHAWRLGTRSQPQATGMVGRGDVHVDAFPTPGGGFLLTSAGHRGPAVAFRIAVDGTASPVSSDCLFAGWPSAAESGRLALVGLSVVDTVTGAVCHSGRHGGRPLARGAFAADGALWALVDKGSAPGTMTIGRYDGAEWRYRDLAATGWPSNSLIAAAGSSVVVVQAAGEPSPQQVVGLAVTTDNGATWSEILDPDVLARDLPFVAYRSPESEDWFSSYTSIAFAGSDVLYVADGRGDLWRSTDFATFSRVTVSGPVGDLTTVGDAVLARIDNGSECGRPAACRLNELVRISADGSVQPITAR